MLSTMRAAVLMMFALAAAGCASAPGRTVNDDRWEGFNRGVYKFNDTIDRAALKPVAKAYKRITPSFVRVGVGNFFNNIGYPTTIVNQFLQGKVVLGLRDTGRLLLNTTLGLGGLFDVATPIGLEANDEDLGQTLAVWGINSGPYLTLPFLGPSSVRDAPSRFADTFLDALSFADIPWEAQWGRRALSVVHSRAELLTLDPTLERTFDPYAFVRDVWVQQREFAIYDGNPPPEELEEEFLEEEPQTEEAAPEEPSEPQPDPQ